MTEPMTILLVGGPKAGTVLVRGPGEHPTLVFPRMARLSSSVFDVATPDPAESVEVLQDEYRPRRGAVGLVLHGRRVIAYHWQGKDKYAEARTFERIVGFQSPHSLDDLYDQAAVEFLIWECSR